MEPDAAKRILILGAGHSTPFLVSFLLDRAAEHGWFVTVGDQDLELATERVAGHDRGTAVYFDINDAKLRHRHISAADLVVNMLPPVFQERVALNCMRHRAHMVSASYEDITMKDLDADAQRQGVVILNEMGLDPGIDLMSAMTMIERVRAGGGFIVSFKSYGSGLPAPEFTGNPLRYAITWNPRNIVMSGEKGATYLVHGKVKMLPHHEIFQRSWSVDVEGIGTMEAYPNRDSIYYRKLFGLDDARTMIRGTLRYPGWCETWHQIVRLGMPNEAMRIPSSEGLTYRDMSEMFLPVHTGDGELEARIADFLDISPTGVIMNNFRWLGLLSDEPVPRNVRTVTEALGSLLRRKLRLGPQDRDMVIIMHEIVARYPQENNREERVVSTMVEYGEPGGLTAMSKSVGLPAGIAATLILTGELELTGCQIATHPTVYPRVLKDLERYGITFSERVERVA